MNIPLDDTIFMNMRRIGLALPGYCITKLRIKTKKNQEDTRRYKIHGKTGPMRMECGDCLQMNAVFTRIQTIFYSSITAEFNPMLVYHK